MVLQNYYQFNATLFWDYFLGLLLKHFIILFFFYLLAKGEKNQFERGERRSQKIESTSHIQEANL